MGVILYNLGELHAPTQGSDMTERSDKIDKYVTSSVCLLFMS